MMTINRAHGFDTKIKDRLYRIEFSAKDGLDEGITIEDVFVREWVDGYRDFTPKHDFEEIEDEVESACYEHVMSEKYR